jgi:hypothetical protein
LRITHGAIVNIDISTAIANHFHRPRRRPAARASTPQQSPTTGLTRAQKPPKMPHAVARRQPPSNGRSQTMPAINKSSVARMSQQSCVN